MRSALSSERSSSSRLGKVRKISDEGKGECRNRPQRMRLKRLRRKLRGACKNVCEQISYVESWVWSERGRWAQSLPPCHSSGQGCVSGQG